MVSKLCSPGSVGGVVDRMIYTCPNGELIDTETGLIVGYSDFKSFPPLSKDAQSLLRHFDGMSAEPLGTVPKIIAISRDEERLLMQLLDFIICILCLI